jgi:predicted transcriptional regulator of viral defense system
MKKVSLNIIEKKLLSQDISIFTLSDFAKIFGVSDKKAGLFLSRYSKKEDSHFIRLKKGIYVFSLLAPEKFEIANKICQPSYISFESALSFYGIIPEIVYSITSATTKRPNSFGIGGINYEYYKLKKKLFFGCRLAEIRRKKVFIAEKEKALLDYLYLVLLEKKVINKRIDLSKIDKKKLKYYAGIFLKNIGKKAAFRATIDNITKKI